MWPLPSNSDHQDCYIFEDRESQPKPSIYHWNPGRGPHPRNNFSHIFLGAGFVGDFFHVFSSRFATKSRGRFSKVSGDVATNIAVAQACILQRQWTRAAELYLLAFALVVLAPWADCLSSQDLCFSEFLHMVCDA